MGEMDDRERWQRPGKTTTPVASGGWCFPLADQDGSSKNPNEDRTWAAHPAVVSTKVTSLRPHSLSKAEFALFS